MKQIDITVKVGMFDVTVTKELRDQFAQLHAEMSGSKPEGQQFPFDEQRRMLRVCEAAAKNHPRIAYGQRLEDCYLEMIHFLNGEGVRIPDVIGSARTHSKRTQGVAMILHQQECGWIKPQLVHA